MDTKAIFSTIFYTLKLILVTSFCHCSEEYLTPEIVKKNGYMVAKSSCNNNGTSIWSKENVGGELRAWVKSIKNQKEYNDDLNNFGSNIYFKLSINSVTKEVIVTSVGKLSFDKNGSNVRFEGWTKSLFTSDDQFHDGFYYGLMRGVNGEISGLCCFFYTLHSFYIFKI